MNGGVTSYTVDGLLFQNPLNRGHTNVHGVLQNLQIVNFSGNALSALHFSGETLGYNVYAAKSAGNCVDLEYTQNPYRFYGLIASHCSDGLNLVNTKAEEFHGARACSATRSTFR